MNDIFPPALTPSHQLLVLALSSGADESVRAWMALGLSRSGLSSDGDTDLTLALRHVTQHQVSHGELLTFLLKQAGPDAWVCAADGLDALDLVLIRQEPATFRALLAHPQCPSRSLLIERPWPADLALSVDKVANGLAETNQAGMLDWWAKTVGPLPSTVWWDAQRETAKILMKHAIEVPSDAPAHWRQRIRAKRLSALDLPDLLAVLPTTREITADERVQDYVQELSVREGKPLARLSSVPNPDQHTVVRRGLDGKNAPWSLLGITIWEAASAIESNDSTRLTLKYELPRLVSVLMGDHPDLPWVPGFPAAPMLAWLSYGGSKEGAHRFLLPPISDVLNWAQAPLADLLLQAIEPTQRLARLSAGSTKRGKLLLSMWQGVLNRRMAEQNQVASQVSSAPHVDRVLCQVVTDPDLRPHLWGERMFTPWLDQIRDKTEPSGYCSKFSAIAQAWFEVQPEPWRLVCQLVSNPSAVHQAVLAQLCEWSNEGRRPSAAECPEVELFLSTHLPEILATWRQEKLDHSVSSSPQSSRRRSRP